MRLAALYTGAKTYFANDDVIDAFGIMAFPAALIVTMPFSYLKDASRATKVIATAGQLLFLAGISYLTALI